MMPPSSTSPTRNGRRTGVPCAQCRETPQSGLPSTCLLSVEALAELLGLEPGIVRRLVWDRRIPYFKISRFVRFDPAEIARWLDDHHVDRERRTP